MRRVLSAVVVMAALGACGGDPATESDVGTTASGLSKRLDTGRIIVKWKSGVSETTKATAHHGQGATKKKALKSGADVVVVPKASTRAILAHYKANSNVASAEIDALVPPDGA